MVLGYHILGNLCVLILHLPRYNWFAKVVNIQNRPSVSKCSSRYSKKTKPRRPTREPDPFWRTKIHGSKCIHI